MRSCENSWGVACRPWHWVPPIPGGMTGSVNFHEQGWKKPATSSRQGCRDPVHQGRQQVWLRPWPREGTTQKPSHRKVVGNYNQGVIIRLPCQDDRYPNGRRQPDVRGIGASPFRQQGNFLRVLSKAVPVSARGRLLVSPTKKPRRDHRIDHIGVCFFCGADGRSRTGTALATAPSRQRVYQFHHVG